MIESIGRYRVVRMLGQGGMGCTYLAEVAGPRGFTRRVVLKLVRDEMNPALAQALLDEARLVASLAHRNVCPVLDFHEIDGHRLVVLDHVDGLDLGELMARRLHLPWTLTAFIGSEVAAALDYAHRRCDAEGRPLGLVHRDVSPSNILLSWEGEVKLADFGVARFARSDGVTNTVAGKLEYMPPEQRSGGDVDGRADVFALGVTLYEAMTGLNPLAGGARRLPRLRAELAPPALAEIIEQATAERAEDRPSAARLRELILDLPTLPRDPAPRLAAYLAGLRGENLRARDALLRAAAGTQRALTYIAARVAPTRRLAILAAVGAVIVLGAALLSFRRHTQARSTPAPSVSPDRTSGVPVTTAPASVAASSDTPRPSPPTPEVRPVPKQPARASTPRRAGGELSVNATPWAQVYLDGRAIGHTPQLGLRVLAGRHTLRLVTSSGDSRTRSVEVVAGRETRVAVNFAEP